MRRRRWFALLLVGLGLGAFVWISPKIPHDQEVEIALGDRASAIRDLHVRYVQSGETQREAAFHWDTGAPQVVKHTPRLPDGDYVVGVETEGKDGAAEVERRITLKDGTVTKIWADAR